MFNISLLRGFNLQGQSIRSRCSEHMSMKVENRESFVLEVHKNTSPIVFNSHLVDNETLSLIFKILDLYWF